jgi:hypothetical protein
MRCRAQHRESRLRRASALLVSLRRELQEGASVCSNNHCVAIESVDRAVLDALSAVLFTPSVVAAVMAGVRDALQPATQAEMARRAKKDLAAVDRQIGNLTDGIALASGALPSLVAKLHEQQQRREALLASIAGAESRADVDLQRADRAEMLAGRARRADQSHAR